MSDWRIFEKGKAPHDRVAELPAAPSWRAHRRPAKGALEETFQVRDKEVEMVNAALYLRRPLLVTGKPGTGKSSLARAVAQQLKLGQLLVWPINTRSTLGEGLYRYDAIGRLQAASLAQLKGKGDAELPAIGQFLRLGPLGTAMLPAKKPRVLLIDEIDKSDIDLPNDLLHIFEEGEFEIPELSRMARLGDKATIRPADSEAEVEVPGGKVQSDEFPLVFLTSNGERDFPPAFMRRCLHLHMDVPTAAELSKIVGAHFAGEEVTAEELSRIKDLIKDFDEARKTKQLSTDQLLNLVYMTLHLDEREGQKPDLAEALLQAIGGEAG